MAHVLPAPEGCINESYLNAQGNAECVEFIKQKLGAPATAAWREGIKIARLAPGEADPVQKGTAIATFVDGRYPQSGNSGKHAAIYLGQNTAGIQVLDQWRQQGKVLPRTIFWVPKGNSLSNNGNAFSVIEW